MNSNDEKVNAILKLVKLEIKLVKLEIDKLEQLTGDLGDLGDLGENTIKLLETFSNQKHTDSSILFTISLFIYFLRVAVHSKIDIKQISTFAKKEMPFTIDLCKMGEKLDESQKLSSDNTLELLLTFEKLNPNKIEVKQIISTFNKISNCN